MKPGACNRGSRVSSLADAPPLTTRREAATYDPAATPPQLVGFEQQEIPRAEWLDGVVPRLVELMRLPRNWDSYGGVAVTRVNAARGLWYLTRFLEVESTAPWVVPLSDGGVQFEWHRPDVDLEITFSDETIEVSASDRIHGIEWEGDPEAALAELPAVVTLL